jgi:hypothetical protein
MMEYLDKAILKALRKTTRDRPANLVQIMGAIDAREKLLISFDELSGGLRRLIEAGKVGEAKPLHFYEPQRGESGMTFSGLTEEEYKVANRSYRDMFQKALKELENAPEVEDGPLIVCQLMFHDGTGWSDEAEEAAENLAEQMNHALPDVANADIIGFEPSSGQINILIYGAGTNAEVDLVYDAISPFFRAFPLQHGSSIIRYYDSRQREVESDLVMKPAI